MTTLTFKKAPRPANTRRLTSPFKAGASCSRNQRLEAAATEPTTRCQRKSAVESARGAIPAHESRHFLSASGRLFDRLRLQLPDPIVNWLTPVWILCVGATAGLILDGRFCGALFWLLSRFPASATLAEQPGKPAAGDWRSDRGFLRCSGRGCISALRPRKGPAARKPRQRPPAGSRRGSQSSRSTACGPLPAAWLRRGSWPRASSCCPATRRWPKRTSPFAKACSGRCSSRRWSWRAAACLGCSSFVSPAELLDSLARWPVLAIEGNAVYSLRTASAAQRVRRSGRKSILDVNFRRDEVRAIIGRERSARPRPLGAVCLDRPIRR